jgi:subtilisin family serine protease
MAKDEVSRRLHPKLRVYRNGDEVVNTLRSEISQSVASAAPVAIDRQLAKSKPVYSLTAQATDYSEGERRLPPLGKRARLDKRPKARHCFANVFIEFLRQRAKGEDDTAESSMQSVEKMIKRGLTGAGRKDLSRSIVARRNFLSATVPVSLLPTLEQEESIAFVHASDTLKLEIPSGTKAGPPPSRAVGSAAIHGRGQGVLIGIVDVGGFDFSHPDFLDENGATRFHSIWDQGGELHDAPPRFGYGSLLTKKQMDAAIAASTKKNGLPAYLLERQSQQQDGSHGTHVASIAAGKRGVCPKAEIVAVLIDVPQPTDSREKRRFTFSDSSRIAHAIEYLLDVAEQRGLPISINVSLGTNGGAHDGSSGVSRWLDAALSTPGRAICVAAGNAGQSDPTSEDDLGWIMGRIHTSGRIAARELDVDLEWTVVGNGIEDVSENELEIWYGAQDRVTVLVKPPSSNEWIEVPPRKYVENKRLPSGTTLSVYNELYHPTNGANYISLYLSPNYEVGNVRGVEPGVWKVKLKGDEIRDGSFHGWIERDDPVSIGTQGQRRLFQFPSFFSKASNVDSHSINSLACGHRVIAVANLHEILQKINVSSSQGPTRDNRCKPDIAASGTDVIAAKGFAGKNDLWVSMTGTSMASPYVAGVIGLMLGANNNLTAAQCEGILQRTAKPLPGATFQWLNDAGYGAINPTGAVEEAKVLNVREQVR